MSQTNNTLQLFIINELFFTTSSGQRVKNCKWPKKKMSVLTEFAFLIEKLIFKWDAGLI